MNLGLPSETAEITLSQIHKLKSFSEQRIYHAVLAENYNFNHHIWKETIKSVAVKEEVEILFNSLNNLIFDELLTNNIEQYHIHFKEKPSKDEIFLGNYKASQIKLAQSIIKDKIAGLNEEFSIPQAQHEDDSKNYVAPSNHKKFDLNSQETKKADEFVKKMQQEQKSIRKKHKKMVQD